MEKRTMFKSKTTFVLGAGASHEVGLPTGNKLKSKIAKKVDIKFAGGGYEQATGSRLIAAVLKRSVQKEDGRQGDINPFLHKAWRMRDAVAQAISIDNYLDAQENKEVSYIAKLAIAEIILDCENNSQLKVIKNHHHQDTIDFLILESTWFHSFFVITHPQHLGILWTDFRILWSTGFETGFFRRVYWCRPRF